MPSFWFQLAKEADAPGWHTPAADPLPDSSRCRWPRQSRRALEGRELSPAPARTCCLSFSGSPALVPRRRRPGQRADVTNVGALPGNPNQLLFSDVETGRWPHGPLFSCRFRSVGRGEPALRRRQAFPTRWSRLRHGPSSVPDRCVFRRATPMGSGQGHARGVP